MDRLKIRTKEPLHLPNSKIGEVLEEIPGPMEKEINLKRVELREEVRKLFEHFMEIDLLDVNMFTARGYAVKNLVEIGGIRTLTILFQLLSDIQKEYGVLFRRTLDEKFEVLETIEKTKKEE